jgi:hypothetical protein
MPPGEEPRKCSSQRWRPASIDFQSQHGFSTFTADTNINFRVQAGKNVYLGRLIVEFPPGLLMVGTGFRIVVEDARDSTLDTARQKSGLSLGDVVTDLMARR